MVGSSGAYMDAGSGAALLAEYCVKDGVGSGSACLLGVLSGKDKSGAPAVGLLAGDPDQDQQLVVELVERQHQKALQILRDDRQKLDELARFLHEKETITGEEFMSILNA